MSEADALDAPVEPQEASQPTHESHEEDELDDIFDDDDEEHEGTSYNRQSANGPAGSGSSSKPSANTRHSVSDQISALSKHAAKIRLDDVKQSQARDKDKADRATSDLVLDDATRLRLLRMINLGVVSEIHGVISTGKEANVYGAVLLPEDGSEPVQMAIKVYKTAILKFKDRERYITGEHRFKSGAEKGNSRKMVKLWAEKEYRNLKRISAQGIPSPTPVELKMNVMVMSFLGDKKGWAYPRLRDAVISSDDEWRDLYVQLLGIMRRLYQVCKLVHADLSEYNILYHDQILYIIDVSQSVEHDHPMSSEFLRMDIKNVGDFFRRHGVDTLADRTIFDFIVAPDGPVRDAEMRQRIEHIYEARVSAGEDDEEAQAEFEVDNQVFRNQYIPQTLEQVYDIEADGRKVGAGQGDSLVYRNLLADQVIASKEGNNEQVEDESDGSDDESEEGAALDAGDGDYSATDSRPRGKRFIDKDEKKVRALPFPRTARFPRILADWVYSNTNKKSRRPNARSERKRCRNTSRRRSSLRHLERSTRRIPKPSARSTRAVSPNLTPPHLQPLPCVTVPFPSTIRIR